jgi:hypothetical protein
MGVHGEQGGWQGERLLERGRWLVGSKRSESESKGLFVRNRRFVCFGYTGAIVRGGEVST